MYDNKRENSGSITVWLEKRSKQNMNDTTPTAVSSQMQVSIIIYNLLYTNVKFFTISSSSQWLRSEGCLSLYGLHIKVYRKENILYTFFKFYS